MADLMAFILYFFLIIVFALFAGWLIGLKWWIPVLVSAAIAFILLSAHPR